MPIAAPAIRLALRVSARLPLRGLYALARAGLRLSGAAAGKSRTFTDVNVQLCFPGLDDAARKALVDASLRHDAYAMAELGPAFFRPAAFVEQRFDDPDANVLLDTLGEGRGVLLCAPHFGAWEMLGQYLALKHTVHALYKPSDVADADNLLLGGRTRFGIALHPTNAAGVRGLHKALADNALVSILPDQEPEASGGAFAPFFGVPALTMTLLARLARKRRVPVVLAAAVRDTERCRFRTVFRRLGDDIYSADTTTALSCMNRAIETLVREHPAQYLWSYRRFRSMPTGQRRGYA
ncbi:MAG: lysophospholipid acyltransferase family protein, partial [Pseudomonadota bacterium]